MTVQVDVHRKARRDTALSMLAEFKQDLINHGFEQWRVDELRHVESRLSLRFNYAGDEWTIRWEAGAIHEFRIDLRLPKSITDQIAPLWSQWLAFQNNRRYLWPEDDADQG